MIRDWKSCTLTTREVEVLRTLADALYDPHGTGRVGANFRNVLDELEAWLTAPDVLSRLSLRAFLFALELSPIRFGFGPRTMTSLNRAERALFVEALEGRSAIFGIWKSLLGTAYFSIPCGTAELRIIGAIPGVSPQTPGVRA